MNFYTFYTNILWLSAYIYGILKPIVNNLCVFATTATKVTYTTIYKNNDSSTLETTKVKVYMSDGEKMLPFTFDISKLHKHHLLYYVVIQIDEVHRKVVVFNSLDTLIFMYNNLHDFVKSRMSKFSKFLEVRNTSNVELEYLNTFTEYTDKTDTYFSELSSYNIRSRDIYDFTNNNFLLAHGDKLHVTKMDLSSHEYKYEDKLGS